ncbi:MAG: hypothetical protein AWU57_310 [Marinobacter sp. T13-3]|nr:MAG: hypothetical protein AWU57_310 [Marinobacter sp. T13-3]
MKLLKQRISLSLAGLALAGAMLPGLTHAQSGDPAATMDFNTMSKQDQRDFCSGVAQTAQAVARELPIRVDRTTTLVGSVASYQDNRCIYFLDYVVNEPGVFEVTYQEMKKAGTVLDSRAETMAFIKDFYATGSQGYQEFKENLRSQLTNNEQFARFAAVPFLELRANYTLKGDDVMDDISIVVGRNNGS